MSKFYFAVIFISPSRGLILFCRDFYFILPLVFVYFAVSLFYSAVSLLCGRSTYAVRTYASAYCHRLSDSVYLSLVWVPESRVTRGSGLIGSGEAYSGGRCKEGCGFQKPRGFWSAA